MDIGGNKYPIKGYVEADNFTNDIDIENGLYGIMWGKTFHLSYEQINEGKWVVVKTEISELLIEIDRLCNRYKFKYGIVVHSGTVTTASQYIIDHKNDEFLINEVKQLQLKEIVGSKKWLKKYGEKIKDRLYI